MLRYDVFFRVYIRNNDDDDDDDDVRPMSSVPPPVTLLSRRLEFHLHCLGLDCFDFRDFALIRDGDSPLLYRGLAYTKE